VYNLSGRAVPSDRLLELFEDALRARGIQLLAPGQTDGVLRRNRVRWTGGIGPDLARTFRSTTGVDTVLLVSFDTFDDDLPPRMAVTARLVTTESEPRILWMDGAHAAGDERFGWLGTGLTDDPDEVLDRVLSRVLESLDRFLEGRAPDRAPRSSRRRFRPRTFAGSVLSVPQTGRRARIAVVPFLNDSAFREAGEIVMLQFVRQLHATGTFQIVEPGVVRAALLQARVIQEGGGLSLSQADAVRSLLRVDAVVTGRVGSFREARGDPRGPEVSFTAHVLDTESRQVVWSGFSFNRGADSEALFQAGRLTSAHQLSFEMTRSAVDAAVRGGASGRQVRF
jgi:hypothetical protein